MNDMWRRNGHPFLNNDCTVRLRRRTRLDALVARCSLCSLFWRRQHVRYFPDACCRQQLSLQGVGRRRRGSKRRGERRVRDGCAKEGNCAVVSSLNHGSMAVSKISWSAPARCTLLLHISTHRPSSSSWTLMNPLLAIHLATSAHNRPLCNPSIL